MPEAFFETLREEYLKNNHFPADVYQRYDVKRGLRNADGTGVVAGITGIANVRGYYIQDGEKTPMPGKLFYRGIEISDLIKGFTSENRYGYAETVYLLLFGALPTETQLGQFSDFMDSILELPAGFTEDMILKAPSPDVMNKLARGVLALYSYDPDPEDMSLPSELRRAVTLIARTSQIVAHGYAAKKYAYDHESLYLHRPQLGLSLAENFLWSARRDNKFTQQEARLLDLCMVLHAEHGGGNNSAFTCRVLSSSGTDLYSSIAGAVGALKGPKHGGANKKVMEMFRAIEDQVRDWKDEDEVKACLGDILDGKAGDGSGLIYGMGHAVYTLSDPRATILKQFARDLAREKHMEEELDLFESVERLAPVVMESRGKSKVFSANVDMFSGFVYKMLNIPVELYTPLFAMSRMAGWCAHRMEELFIPGGRIIRPAYKAVFPKSRYVPLIERGK